MTVEQIAIRQEIRQMLNEAGINKNVLKDMVKDVLKEEVGKACIQTIHETDVDGIVKFKLDHRFTQIVKDAVKETITERVNGIFHRMQISVDITDKNGTSTIAR